MTRLPRVSMVVPLRNEAQAMPALLAHLAALQDDGVQVILVDGGSSDATVSMAEGAGFKVLHSAPGRARQMNAGAAGATGEVLLFLHADTRLPPGALAALAALAPSAADAANRPGALWGRFDVRISGRPALLRVVAALMNARSRLTGIATGDQAIFVRQAVFSQIGGFAPLALMEDIELSRRLKRLSPPLCLRLKVTTSGRRWEQRGVWRTIFLMWRLRFAYWRGVPADQLARDYA